MPRPVRLLIVATTAALFVAAVLCYPLSAPVHASNSKAQKRLGAALFHEKGCEHCHGIDARGGELGPDLSTIGKRWKKPQIEHQIHDGGAGMPAFGDALQPDEIAALVEFLHAKRKAPKQPKHASPASAPAAPPVN